MTPLEYIIGGLLGLLGIVLIILILKQQSKRRGLSGAIAGGSSESYFGKNKGKTKEQLINKMTAVLGVVFVALVLTLYIANTVINREEDITADSVSAVSQTAAVEENTESATEQDEVQAQSEDEAE